MVLCILLCILFRQKPETQKMSIYTRNFYFGGAGNQIQGLSHVLGKRPTTELYPQPKRHILKIPFKIRILVYQCLMIKGSR